MNTELIKLLTLPICFFGSMTGIFILELLNRKKGTLIYGISYDKYDKLSCSQQTRMRFEWNLDNNKEDINKVDEIIKLVNEGNVKDIGTARQMLNECNKISLKYDSVYIPIRYELLSIIQELTPKEDQK